MTSIYDELFEFFDIFGESVKGKYAPMDSSPEDYKYLNDRDDYGIFFVSDFKSEYTESCSGISLESKRVNINNVVKNGYILSCKVPGFQSEFARVCESLILEDRKSISEDPSIWFDKWKDAFGNRNLVRSTYQVIGELVVLRELLKHGYSDASWQGPDAGVCDICAPASDLYFEVKSTLVRNSSFVTITEEFQAKKADYLCFCRFEEDPHGECSIDSVVEELSSMGYDRSKLDSGLRKLGFRDTSLRRTCYHCLEILYYPVENNIPAITDFFIDKMKPPFMERISYTLNISGLKYEKDVPAKKNKRTS